MLKDGTVKALVIVTFSYGGRMLTSLGKLWSVYYQSYIITILSEVGGGMSTAVCYIISRLLGSDILCSTILSQINEVEELEGSHLSGHGVWARISLSLTIL